MVAAAIDSSQAALSKKRAQFAGPSGIKGLLSSAHVFAIAVFASLGGFVYGCKYACGGGPEECHRLTSSRQPRHVWTDPEHDILLEHCPP